MIPDYILNQIEDDDLKFRNTNPKSFTLPAYDPKTHYIEELIKIK